MYYTILLLLYIFNIYTIYIYLYLYYLYDHIWTKNAAAAAAYHGNSQMYRRFGDRIRDGCARTAEHHDLAGAVVDHVEERFHADRRAALFGEKQRINKENVINTRHISLIIHRNG